MIDVTFEEFSEKALQTVSKPESSSYFCYGKVAHGDVECFGWTKKVKVKIDNFGSLDNEYNVANNLMVKQVYVFYKTNTEYYYALCFDADDFRAIPATEIENLILQDEDKMFFTDIDFAETGNYDLLAQLYVPFNSTSNSKIPVLWVEALENTEDVHDGITLPIRLSDDIVISGDDFVELFKSLKADYPSLDLETTQEDRFANIRIEFPNSSVSNDFSLRYNRNHVAYNGTSTTADVIEPIVSIAMYIVEEFIVPEDYYNSVDNYLMEVVRDTDFSLRRNTAGSTNNGTPQAVPTNFMNPPQDEDSRQTTDNPLMDAANFIE